MIMGLQSSSNIPEIKMLAFDIQLEIIKRLPVKSIIQFRSVCKAWKSFIDSSQFITSYKVPHTQPQHLLIKYEEVGDWEDKCVCFVDDDTFPQQKFVPTLPPPLLQLLDRSNVIGSSGGLLFFDSFFQEQDNSITGMIVLWNPVIRKSIAVALPPNLVHPQRSNAVLGFGVCPDTNDPKLVRITYIYDCSWNMESIPCQVMVFTLSTGEWTCLSSNHQPPRKSIEFFESSTVIGQFIYWFAYDRIDVDGDKPHNLIMSFDLRTEKFREIDLPDCLANETKLDMSVSRLRESLAVLLQYGLNFDGQFCDVWIMEHGDSNAFTKLFTINRQNESSSALLSRTLGFRKSGEPIVEMDDGDSPFALAVYEPCSEHVKDLGICGNGLSVYSYTESLLLLDHDDGHIVRCGDVKR